MKTFKEIFGYLLGALLFVVLMPAVMWLASGMPPIVHIGALKAVITGVLMVGGLSLSIWTIVYMKRRGKGNPMDAFGHEVAPRTQHLMTDGPYRLNRNPMLTGTLTFLAGCVVWLWTWQAAAVWGLHQKKSAVLRFQNCGIGADLHAAQSGRGEDKLLCGGSGMAADIRLLILRDEGRIYTVGIRQRFHKCICGNHLLGLP